MVEKPGDTVVVGRWGKTPGKCRARPLPMDIPDGGVKVEEGSEAEGSAIGGGEGRWQEGGLPGKGGSELPSRPRCCFRWCWRGKFVWILWRRCSLFRMVGVLNIAESLEWRARIRPAVSRVAISRAFSTPNGGDGERSGIRATSPHPLPGCCHDDADMELKDVQRAAIWRVWCRGFEIRIGELVRLYEIGGGPCDRCRRLMQRTERPWADGFSVSGGSSLPLVSCHRDRA